MKIFSGLALGGGIIVAANQYRKGNLGLPMTLVSRVDPEVAHKLAVWACKVGFAPAPQIPDDPILSSTCWGISFSNPIGLAAGFDKSAEALPGTSTMGFGFVEIGSVTPLPQLGNPLPRVFRLTEDQAVINRYGFNNDGADVVASRLKAWARHNIQTDQTQKNHIPLGVNLGKNKLSEDAISDYMIGVRKMGIYADYIVVNVSSPNTPNLRDLQHDSQLSLLYEAAQRDIIVKEYYIQTHIPVLIKIAPDLDENQKKTIAKTALELGIEGIIISNTTVQREGLKSPHGNEIGGLSGKPLAQMSTNVLREMYEMTEGKIPLIGVGGVFTGQDALDKIEAGASLVQLYTAMSLEGPQVVPQIKRELTELLKQKGYRSIKEAQGAKTSVGRTTE